MIQSTEDLLREYPGSPARSLGFSDDEDFDVSYGGIDDDDSLFDLGSKRYPESPYKNKKYDDLSVYSDFHIGKDKTSSRKRSKSVGVVGDDTIDRLLAEAASSGRVRGGGGAGGLDPEKTDFIIRETHNIINGLPSDIVGSKQGENYQNLLASSINKLTVQLEGVRRENRELQKQCTLNKDQKRQLKEQVVQYKREAARAKEETERVKESKDALRKQVAADSAASLKERDLLRSKLVKYKNLYEQEVRKQEVEQKQKVQVQAPAPAPAPAPKSEPISKSVDQDALKAFVLQLVRENSPSKVNEENDTPKKEVRFEDKVRESDILRAVEAIVQKLAASNHEVQPAPESPKQTGSSSSVSVKNESFDEKVLESEVSVSGSEDESSSHTSDSGPSGARPGDVIVKCFIHYPESPSKAANHKEKCVYCNNKKRGEGSGETHKADPQVVVDNGDTINLMGEYKWEL